MSSETGWSTVGIEFPEGGQVEMSNRDRERKLKLVVTDQG